MKIKLFIIILSLLVTNIVFAKDTGVSGTHEIIKTKAEQKAQKKRVKANEAKIAQLIASIDASFKVHHKLSAEFRTLEKNNKFSTICLGLADLKNEINALDSLPEDVLSINDRKKLKVEFLKAYNIEKKNLYAKTKDRCP